MSFKWFEYDYKYINKEVYNIQPYFSGSYFQEVVKVPVNAIGRNVNNSST